jgi:hypothetical protein
VTLPEIESLPVEHGSPRGGHDTFRLIATVKRGVACDLDELAQCYSTLDEAREAARALGRHELVTHVMITRDDVPPTFVEWIIY